jgi:hypothetical protein
MIKSKTVWRLLLAVALLASSALPVATQAQSGTPSYAKHEDRIQGTVSGFNGAYTVYVRDDRGYVDNVTLRNGTIINPTGLRLTEGQRVTIYGFAQGNAFVANQIDTAYTKWPAYGYSYAPPPPPYPYYPYPYPYYYGYGPYYYGPWLRVGVVFGPRYYVRGGYYGRYYGRWR